MHLDETALMFDEQEMRKGFEKKTTFMWRLRENNALQPKKAHITKRKKQHITESSMSTTL